jgi:mRNA-degrading endonuclease RelE of RelBE toxin-antitoxin system
MIRMTSNLAAALLQIAKGTSGREPSSRPWTKPQDTTQPGIPELAGRGWFVEFAPRAARVAARMGLESKDFNPTLIEIVAALERNPKQFPKKTGPLSHVRAVSTKYRGAAWRVPFALHEDERVVVILAIAKHDEAYRAAGR